MLISLLKALAVYLIIFSSFLFPQKKGNQYRFFHNNINLPINNYGLLAYVNIDGPSPSLSGPGGKFAGDIFLFSSSFFVSGKENGVLWANGVGYLLNDYIPGPSNGPFDSSLAQIYLVKKDDPPFGQSWIDWKDAVSLGADFYDGDMNGIYNPVDKNSNGKFDYNEDSPDLLGDVTAWCIYHDGRPSAQRRWTNNSPQGIEIQQTLFAKQSSGDMGNVIFIRYRLKNSGLIAENLDSVYFSIFSDPDIGGAVDDLLATDVPRNSAYVYNNGPDPNPAYGNNPPSMYATFLSGPISFIPGISFIDNNSNGSFENGIDSPLDTAIVLRGPSLGNESIPGALNLSLSSNVMLTSTSFPQNENEARNVMLGKLYNGSQIDPCIWNQGIVNAGADCSTLDKAFWFSGDPVTNSGWINSVEGDKHIIASIGPFELKKNEEKDIIISYSVGINTTPSGIAAVRGVVDKAQKFADMNFSDLPTGILSPAEGEQLTAGALHKIFWNFPGMQIIPESEIYLRVDGKDNFIAGGINLMDSSYLWRVPNLASDDCRIVIKPEGWMSEVESKVFSIKASAFDNNNTAKFLSVNNVQISFDKKGMIGDVNSAIPGAGGFFEEGMFLYSGGFFLAGKNGETYWANGMASSSLVQDYQSGTVGMNPSSLNAKIYSVKGSDEHFGTSWQNWKKAVEMGADFYDGHNDGIYDPVDLNGNGFWEPNEDMPDLLGDQTLWCVYNDAVPSDQRRFADASPLGIEIRQTAFAFAGDKKSLANTVFIRYRIVNTGTISSKLDSVYFSAWSDPDLGNQVDDLGGSDSLRVSAYFYNNGPDDIYGEGAPAFYSRLLNGPVTYIPNETFIDQNGNQIYDEGIDTAVDTARIIMGKNLGIKLFPGAKNLTPSSMIFTRNADPLYAGPFNVNEAYNCIQGNLKSGIPIDPCNASYGVFLGQNGCSDVNPKFWYSGDPINFAGFLNDTGGDQRKWLNTGPFSLEENKDVEFVIAYTLGRGENIYQSIADARISSDEAAEFFHSNSMSPSVDIEDENEVIENFNLAQNYPNPFNPVTQIKFAIPQDGIVSLKIFDVLGKEVKTLVDEYRNKGSYEVSFNASNLASGVYLYQIKVNDFSATKKMMLLK